MQMIFAQEDRYGLVQRTSIIDVLLKECKKCKCLEAGCECDPNAVNPDELCSRNEQCVNCQCLPFGKPSEF